MTITLHATFDRTVARSAPSKRDGGAGGEKGADDGGSFAPEMLVDAAAYVAVAGPTEVVLGTVAARSAETVGGVQQVESHQNGCQFTQDSEQLASCERWRLTSRSSPST